jgi:IS5 family transposase
MARKQVYRIRNWREYNAALKRRGALTVWVDERMVAAWQARGASGRRGRPLTYTDIAIQCVLTLKVVYQLPLRATEGLVCSLVALMGLELPVPDYTTVSRRQKTLEVQIPRSAPRAPLHVVVDSTGLKVFGEGEWKVRQHGYTKRRTWRKLHLGVDEASGEVVAVVLTPNGVGDNEVLPELLEQVDGTVGQVSGDGSYDTRGCYRAVLGRGAQLVVPPRATAQYWTEHSPEGRARNAALRAIKQVGRAQWKRASGYHRRSLAETAMFRQKALFGQHLKARDPEAQVTEAFVRCGALNRITRLGMPESHRVA